MALSVPLFCSCRLQFQLLISLNNLRNDFEAGMYGATRQEEVRKARRELDFGESENGSRPRRSRSGLVVLALLELEGLHRIGDVADGFCHA